MGALPLLLSLVVQLQHRHERLRGHLHRAQGAHLLFARPTGLTPCGDPDHFNARAGMDPALRRSSAAARLRIYGAGAARLRRAEGKSKLRSYPSSSSFNTAMNASVGICTVPRERIFFLPSFCFSSSFFFRVMSPP